MRLDSQFRTVGTLAAMGVLLTACSSGGDELTRQTREVVPAAVSESESFTDAFPLTGEPTDDPRTEQPVVAVKIDNSPAARPQAGLEAADVVYEQIVEGGVTRFAALYHSELPEVVGPVRSGRLVDVEILDDWHPILVYSGARGDVEQALRQTSIGLYPDAGRPVYSRERGRPGSHDLMADLTEVLEVAADIEDFAPAPAPWTFADEPPAGGEASEGVEISMASSNVTSWAYDEDEGVYRRSQNGNATTVVGDGRIGAANVVVILTDVGPGGCCDTAGSRFTATRFDGDGDAVVLRDGQWFDVTWSKPSSTAHLDLRGADGQPFALRPGPTWIHLAPLGAATPTVATDPTASESDG